MTFQQRRVMLSDYFTVFNRTQCSACSAVGVKIPDKYNDNRKKCQERGLMRHATLVNAKRIYNRFKGDFIERQR
jgi:hypothetical protein